MLKLHGKDQTKAFCLAQVVNMIKKLVCMIFWKLQDLQNLEIGHIEENESNFRNLEHLKITGAISCFYTRKLATSLKVSVVLKF